MSSKSRPIVSLAETLVETGLNYEILLSPSRTNQTEDVQNRTRSAPRVLRIQTRVLPRGKNQVLSLEAVHRDDLQDLLHAFDTANSADSVTSATASMEKNFVPEY